MTPTAETNLRYLVEPVRLLALDVDGTLTDGSIHLSGDGAEHKVFNAHDGQGIKLMMDAGHYVAFISARKSDVVARRAAELGIDLVRQGTHDKRDALAELQAELGVTVAQTAAMGDDLPDLGLFSRAGLRLTVPNAAAEVRAMAHWTSERPAGQGAVREAIEVILRTQKRWDEVTAFFRR
jgi:3-deoxy-D-manno-octulosonate 8-phosphate phosphatase (KDO 8-P phosphatase)